MLTFINNMTDKFDKTLNLNLNSNYIESEYHENQELIDLYLNLNFYDN